MGSDFAHLRPPVRLSSARSRGGRSRGGPVAIGTSGSSLSPSLTTAGAWTARGQLVAQLRDRSGAARLGAEANLGPLLAGSARRSEACPSPNEHRGLCVAGADRDHLCVDLPEREHPHPCALLERHQGSHDFIAAGSRSQLPAPEPKPAAPYGRPRFVFGGITSVDDDRYEPTTLCPLDQVKCGKPRPRSGCCHTIPYEPLSSGAATTRNFDNALKHRLGRDDIESGRGSFGLSRSVSRFPNDSCCFESWLVDAPGRSCRWSRPSWPAGSGRRVMVSSVRRRRREGSG